MILITGGIYQGKRDFALRTWDLTEDRIADGESCDPRALSSAAAVDRFHLLIRRLLSAGEDAGAYTEELIREYPDLIIITDEVGAGVVPADAFERQYRDEAGFAAQRIAASASEVWRVYCGIATRIK